MRRDSAQERLIGDLYAHASGIRGGVVDARDMEGGEQIVTHAIDHTDYDWSRLEGVPITVKWRRLPADTNAEIVMWSDHAEVALDTRLKSESLDVQAATLLAELAHAVDVYTLTDQQRQDIFDAFHGNPEDHAHSGVSKSGRPRYPKDHGHGWFSGDYWKQVGESFMGAFVMAYSDLPLPSDLLAFEHRPTPEIAERVREIIERE